MTPVKTLDMSQVTSPIMQVDKALETKIETADADTATDVVQVYFLSENTALATIFHNQLSFPSKSSNI